MICDAAYSVRKLHTIIYNYYRYLNLNLFFSTLVMLRDTLFCQMHLVRLGSNLPISLLSSDRAKENIHILERSALCFGKKGSETSGDDVDGSKEEELG